MSPMKLSNSTPVFDLPVSIQIRNILIKAGFKTVGQVRRLTDAELLALPNLGRKSFNDLKEAITNRIENTAINAVTKWCRESPIDSTPRKLLYSQRAAIARAVLEALK